MIATEERRSEALSFRITPSLKTALEQLAKADKRPLSNYLEVLLEAHVQQKNVPQGQTGGTQKSGKSRK